MNCIISFVRMDLGSLCVYAHLGSYNFYEKPSLLHKMISAIYLVQALIAIRSLLHLSSTDASDFKDFCGLDGVLDRTREQLEKLMNVEEREDYAREVEGLRREVSAIFHQKLDEVRSGLP